jgi:hypothetical protein
MKSALRAAGMAALYASAVTVGLTVAFLVSVAIHAGWR